MKLAGQKNPGAWERARKDLSLFTITQTQALNLAIQGLDELAPAYGAMVDYYTQMGLDPTKLPASAQIWAYNLAEGKIALQVWMGKLTTTTYSKVNGKWKANYQSPMHYFAKELRKLVKRFTVAQEQIDNVLVNEAYNPNTRAAMVAKPALVGAKK